MPFLKKNIQNILKTLKNFKIFELNSEKVEIRKYTQFFKFLRSFKVNRR